MTTLDRYIIRTFLANFVILLTVLLLLFVVVDFIIDMDEFFQAGHARAEEFGGFIWATAYTIFDYYLPLMLLIYVFFSGLIVTAAMGFTLAGMVTRRELTAMIASGISLHRVAAPILVTGVALSALSLPVQEFVLPDLAPKLARGKPDLKYGSLQSFPVEYARSGSGALFTASDFDADAGELKHLEILERDQRGWATRRITASSALWQPPANPDDPDAQGTWKLYQGQAIRPQVLARDSAIATSAPLEPEPVQSYQTDLSPTVLLADRAAIYARLLSLGELRAMQGNQALRPDQRAEVTQIVWSRFSLLVLNALVLAMAMPFFLLRVPRNLLTQATKAAGLCLGAWAAGLTMLQIAPEGVSPVLVAWLPVVIYLPVTAVLLQTVET